MLNGYNFFFLASIFIILAGCAPKHPVWVEDIEPRPGDFFSGDGRQLSPHELAQQIKDHDYILVGESHDNLCDHEVQASIIDLLGREDVDLVLGLEMVNVRKHKVLEEFNQGGMTLEELPERLHWDQNWGYDFDLYRPVFARALEHSVPVKALNVPSEIVRKISHYGLEGLDQEEMLYLPREIIPPPRDQLDHLERQYEIHLEFIPEDRAELEHFIQAQSVWDSQMAGMASYWRQRTSRTVLILAGNEHVRRGWGIEHRLLEIDPDASITRVVPVRDPEDISRENPFYFFCPPAHQGRMRLGLVASEENGRVFLRGVVPGSAADEAGLKGGDEILRAGAAKVSAMSDLHRAAKEALESEVPILFEVLRHGEVKTFEVDLVR